MNRILKTAGVLLLSATLTGMASAIPMAGTIEINLDTSAFSFDSSSIDFEQPTSGVVNDATGAYTGYIGQMVTYKDFDYTAVPAGGIADLWSIPGAGISFSLADLLFADYTMAENFEFLTLYGKGWLHVAGQDDMPAWWSFSADSNNGLHNYSSTNSVPDSGASMALLGIGLLTLGAATRMKKRKDEALA